MITRRVRNVLGVDLEMKQQPFWWEAAPLREMSETSVNSSCDVAVIGSGYAGLHAAIGLVRAGRSVQVFEKEQAGFGGSSRNGGIVSGTTKFRLSEIIETLGLENSKALFQEGLDAEAWLNNFITSEKLDCDYARPGRFRGAYRARDYEALARDADAINKHFNRGVAVISKADQHSEIGTDFYHGGISDDDVCSIHPGRYHAELLRTALAAGVTVHAHCPMLGFRRENDGFEVQTKRGKTRARELVIATNAYTDEAQPWLRSRIVPAQSQIIATEPLPKEVMDRLMPKKRMLVDTRIMFPYYRPSPDHTRIIFGGRAGAWSSNPNVKASALKKVMVGIFPELAQTSLSHVWWGYVGFPFDFRPKLAHVDGVHYATGFCGSGTVWASWFGQLAARRIIEEGSVKSALGSDPFETRPLYWGWPWFLPFIIGSYRLRDAL